MAIKRQASLDPFEPPSGSHAPPVGKAFTEALPLGELIQYRCAVAVGEELHFTRAARRLHMDQSAVSRHIQKLEAKLGIKLFVRSWRGVELTNAGEGFIPYARNSVVSASNGERFAQAIARGDPQEFEVAYSPVVDMHLIAQLRSLVEGARHDVPVRFRSVATEKLTDRLFEGGSHAAIGILPVPDEIAKACILREKLFIALPTTHRLAQRRTIHAAQLSDDPVIWTFGVEDSTVSKHLVGLLRKAGYIPNISRQAQSVAEALGLVREGFGVALVKTSELRLHPEGVVIRPFSEPYLVVETGLLYLAQHGWGLPTEFVSLVTQNLRCAEQAASV
jgi:DNA-binding transcriptional LysR family regulator